MQPRLDKVKYRAEDEMLEAFVHRVRNGLSSLNVSKGAPSNPLNLSNLSNLPEGYEAMTDQANEAFIGC